MGVGLGAGVVGMGFTSGALEGSWLGWTEGSWLGSSEGSAVGSTEGSGVGVAVGSTDSTASEGSLGTTVSLDPLLLHPDSRDSARAALRVKAKMRFICHELLFVELLCGHDPIFT